MQGVRQDVRFARRLLWQDRGFALTAIVTLAVCIGANAAIFGVVNSVLLQPLPVPHAEQLIFMFNAYRGRGPRPREARASRIISIGFEKPPSSRSRRCIARAA